MLLLFIRVTRFCHYSVETSHSAGESRDSNTCYNALGSVASFLRHSFTSIYISLIVHLINTRVFDDSLNIKITKSSKILQLFVLIFLRSLISLLWLAVPCLVRFFNRFEIDYRFTLHICLHLTYLF